VRVQKNFKVLITGTSQGIGLSSALKFLTEGCVVVGVDLLPPLDSLNCYCNYTHLQYNIADLNLPVPDDVEILVNNAGVQSSEDDIDSNLRSTIDFTEKVLEKNIATLKSILFVASASAHSGAEFAYYSASKGGILSYMKNVARRCAKHRITCNSISPGGVLTALNDPVTKDKTLWSRLMKITPMKKWMTSEECADWIYFMTVINKSCTGVDILIDNGENSIPASTEFIWT
jgi:3-oxoacyl-[acyl-carrier protein] reductase